MNASNKLDAAQDAWLASLPDEARQLLSGGDAKRFVAAVDRIEIGGKFSFTLPAPGVTAIVGGNNAGKTTLLNQIRDRFFANNSRYVPSPPLLTDLSFRIEGSLADRYDWFIRNRKSVIRTSGVSFTEHPSFDLTWSPGFEGRNPLRATTDSLDDLGSRVMRHFTIEERFQMARPGSRRDGPESHLTHPLHVFDVDPSRRKRLSQLCEEAFGLPLTLDQVSMNLAFRVGSIEGEAPRLGEYTDEYTNKLSSLPPLYSQGAGMVHMIGLLMPIMASTYPVILIDEPEAFLHPPQARLLGRTLGELAVEYGQQLIIGTHDRNILIGLFDVADLPLSLLRLSRDREKSHATSLPKESVEEIWRSSHLRFSNVIEGLFHQLVILCEGYDDCRFYMAAFEAENKKRKLPISPYDVLFLPSSGVAGMAALARLLVSFGVPTVASPDLDVLSDKARLKTLVQSLGSDFTDLDPVFDTATAGLRNAASSLLCKDVRVLVDAELDKAPEARYTNAVKTEVQRKLRVSSPWNAVKEFGEAAIKGAPVARKDLLDGLEACKVVALRVGELESFGPSLEVAKGPLWVDAALQAGLHESPDASNHVRRLVRAAGWKIGEPESP